MMYAVIDGDDYSENCCYGAYPTLSEAQEILLSEAEDWAYGVLMSEDPEDFWGEAKWDDKYDYPRLMRYAVETFKIIEVPVFD